MSRGKRQLSLIGQVDARLNGMLALGQSKHQAKKDGTAKDHIYSGNTLDRYKKDCCRFMNWVTEEKGYAKKSARLEDVRQYAPEYIHAMINEGKSAYTIHSAVAGLAKLYGCSAPDFGVELPSRRMENITRSRREDTQNEYHFSEKNNRDFVDFCRGTGLRRREVSRIRGDALFFRNGKPWLIVDEGTKGGKPRVCPIIGENKDKIVSMLQSAGTGRVFDKVPTHADIHGYRREYATALYQANARTFEECLTSPFWNAEHKNGKGKPKGGYDKNSVYRCRGARKGQWMDKQAMLTVSQALGHNRISVVGEHYITV